MVKRRVFVLSFLILFVGSRSFAMTRHVPTEYNTIQSGINTAVNGDTVLVDTGLYYENINLRGKHIVVASRYLLNGDPDFIANTIINGSQQQDPDTGSVVLMISGEDTTTVLEGFTLTGGTGTPLQDQVNGQTYVEGGGIMIENSSPTIRHNLIVNNFAMRRPAGITSAGGGGIRAGFGSPHILNNVIVGNAGRYGGGIVMNYAHGVIRNNVICQNLGGQDYGGSGLWMYASDSLQVENNTIVGNASVLTGGGIRIWSSTMTGRNNIVWGNRAQQGAAQIAGAVSTANLTYSCVQGGWTGTGNLELYPQFADDNLLIAANSPCIDAGDPDPAYNDHDGSRNDMGSYGGSHGSLFPHFSYPTILSSPSLAFGNGGPGIPVHADLIIHNYGSGTLHLDSVRLGPSAVGIVTVDNLPGAISPVTQDTAQLTWTANGSTPLADTLYLYHNDPLTSQPLKIALVGQIGSGTAPNENPHLPQVIRWEQNFPNPFNPSTIISFTLPRSSEVKLVVYDVTGRLVQTLQEGRLEAGEHSVDFDGHDFPSGIYFARMEAGGVEKTQKMVLMK